MDSLYENIENEGGPSILSSEDIPVLTIPKSSTSFDAGSSSSDEIVINLNITTTDVEGNALNLYSGLCNIKFIDTQQTEDLVPLDDYAIASDNEDEVNDIFTESKWMNVVDENDMAFDFDESNPVAGHPVTVEHHNTYITQNIINYGGESFIQYDQEQQQDDAPRSVQSRADLNYEDFVSEMQEEVIVGEAQNEESSEVLDYENRDNALKQLLTTNLIGSHKQSKTIVFSGKDFLQGHTIQKISFNDPDLKCRKKRRSKQVRIADLPNPNQKKYQCDQCKDIFIDISSFKEHIGIHQNKAATPAKIPVNYICTICSRVLKSQKKIKIHAQGHGDPNLECSQCFQVFASKLTCKKHLESHKKETSCSICHKKFTSSIRMKRHQAKMHSNQVCEVCNFVAKTFEDLVEHVRSHDNNHEKQVTIAAEEADSQDSNEVDLITFDDVQELESSSTIEASLPDNDENAGITNDEADHLDDAAADTDKTRKEADSVMQKVKSSKVFQKKYKTARVLKELKTCDVCMKSFDRMSDLKRHLIEHFIKCTIATTPINEDGSFDILCGICEKAFFTDFNSYKDHLRKHAKLTIYRCTICNKSFSDSSNFSKHKKIHGVSYFQCDLCSRRFHSKKMIAQHMEYHSQHKPITCKYCGKIYHFQSNLNKHIRAAHNKISNKFRCRYCDQLLQSVKEKWDHEWSVHNVRKVLADCEICDAKFRKYSELKQHCKKYHSFEILVVDGEIPIGTNVQSLQYI